MKRPRPNWECMGDGAKSANRMISVQNSLFIQPQQQLSSPTELYETKPTTIERSTVAVATSPESSSSSVDSSRTQTSTGALRNAVAGAMAGIFSRTMTAPIERVKLMLQLQRAPSLSSSFASSPSGNNKWNAWKVCRHIYTSEGGLWAFWRGNTPNVLRQAGASALNFMLMDCYKGAISPIMSATITLSSSRPPETRRNHEKMLAGFLSGGLAGGSTTTILYPIEFMRTRLALDVGSSRMYPRGMRDVLNAVWKSDGIRGMYQGYGIALTGVVIYRALHLGGYDACKTELLYRRRRRNAPGCDKNGCDVESTISMSERFAIAQTVSITAGTICYPIDSVRRRLMMQAGQPIDARDYINSIDAFRKIFKIEGIGGFYLGVGPNIVRSIAGALLLVSYDVFREGMAG